MKTIKIVSAALLALLCTSLGAQESTSLLASVKFAPEMNRIETWVYNIHDNNSEEVFARISHPVISQTFYTDYVEISYEEAIFETGPSMEDWMSSPFEFEPFEEDLSVEEWMGEPFEVEEFIPLEDWMTAANW